MRRLIIYIIVLSTFGCASVSSPGGGPKDESAPILYNSDPADQTVNYKGGTITLEFNERVDLNNYQEEILITPRLKNPIEASVKKNKVILSIKDTLLDNTTYTIAFRESIRDITENNPAENLRLAFSTGSYIDSSYIRGKVIDLMKQTVRKNILVGAYFADDTLSILNQAPDYLSITEEDGTFELSNLKPSKYRLYILNDQNKNSILDFKTESYGFISDTLQLDTSIVALEIPIGFNDRRPIEYQSARASGKYFLIRYNKYISDYIIESTDSLSSRIDDDDTGIKFFNTIGSDSSQIYITAYDTLGYASSRDTIMVKFNESPRSPDKYIEQITSKNIILGINEADLTLQFNKPTKVLTQDSIYIQLDTITSVRIPDSLMVWDKYRTKLSININLDSALHDSLNISKSQFIIGDNSFISVELDSSKRKETRLKWVQLEDTGVIDVLVTPNGNSFFVQLLDQKYNVLQTQYNTEKYSFNHLAPGNYILRLLVDENNDGKWSSGNITDNSPPEKVIIYQKSDGTNVLSLKANWVLGPHEFIIN